MPALYGPGVPSAEADLDVYGLRVRVHGWPDVVERLRLDFAWFDDGHGGRPADVSVEIEPGSPDYAGLGDAPAAFVTPRNVVYQQDGRTIVDYFGRAMSVRDGDRLTVRADDDRVAYEAAYQFLLSRVGEHLDSRGLPRLHSLGLAGADGAVAVLLPSGGGKSTLALRALRSDGVRLLSEDSPLMDPSGRLHPFPLRLAVNAVNAADLPQANVRRIERMELQTKAVLEVAAFADRIEREPQPLRHLVVGRRSLGTEPRLEPLPRRAAVGTLLREAVVGVGIYQGMEFVLQRGMRDVLRQSRPAATRATCCAAILARAQVWQLTLGRDQDRNWQLLEGLLREPASR
jgi:hypothetical protein